MSQKQYQKTTKRIDPRRVESFHSAHGVRSTATALPRQSLYMYQHFKKDEVQVRYYSSGLLQSTYNNTPPRALVEMDRKVGYCSTPRPSLGSYPEPKGGSGKRPGKMRLSIGICKSHLETTRVWMETFVLI